MFVCLYKTLNFSLNEIFSCNKHLCYHLEGHLGLVKLYKLYLIHLIDTISEILLSFQKTVKVQTI